MKRVNSYDLWDTVVTRLVLEPKDIFFLVERAIGVAGFGKKRIEAERNARRTKEEVTIDEIYSQLPYTPECKVALKNAEFDLECRMCSRIDEIAREISVEDVVISDMYWGEEALRRMVSDASVDLSKNRWFVSCDQFSTKRTGRLYESAKRAARIDRHIGDNDHSDVRMARRAGLDARHYKGAAPNRLEQRWHAMGGDVRYMGGVLRASRLSCPFPSESDRAQWEVFCEIVAPLLIGFVKSLLDDCIKKGIFEVYFLSRDGQILYRIANRLTEEIGLPIVCRYIYASRQALHLPGHMSVADSLGWILAKAESLTLRMIAGRTRVRLDTLCEIASDYTSVGPDHELESDSVARSIVADERFVRALEQQSADAYEIAADYYKSIGLLAAGVERAAIVDVGWNGRMQVSINNLLRKAGIEKEIHGYYLGVNENFAVKDGRLVNGYLCSAFEPHKPDVWVRRYINLLEFFLPADHGSVIGFSWSKEAAAAVPMFDKEPDARETALTAVRQSAVLKTLENMIRFKTATGIDLLEAPLLGVEYFRDFVERPPRDLAIAFLDDRHSEEQVRTRHVPIVRKITFGHLILRKRRHRFGIWKEGTFAISRKLWLLDVVATIKAWGANEYRMRRS